MRKLTPLLLLAALTLLGRAAHSDDSALWQTDWIEHNGHEYRMTIPMNWTAAEFLAQDHGAHLVAINDAAENEWVYDNLVVPFGSPTWGAWIGIWDGQFEGTFRWVNGENNSYTNWAPGSPVDIGSGTDYTFMSGHSASNQAMWKDQTALRPILQL